MANVPGVDPSAFSPADQATALASIDVASPSAQASLAPASFNSLKRKAPSNDTLADSNAGSVAANAGSVAANAGSVAANTGSVADSTSKPPPTAPKFHKKRAAARAKLLDTSFRALIKAQHNAGMASFKAYSGPDAPHVITRTYPTPPNRQSAIHHTTSPLPPPTSVVDLLCPATTTPDYHTRPLIILDVNGVLADRIRVPLELQNDEMLPTYMKWLMEGTPQCPFGVPVHCFKNGKYGKIYEPLQNPLLANVPNRDTLGHAAVGCVANAYTVPKRYLPALIETLSKSFTVAVWSSAMRPTVTQLAESLLPPTIPLLFSWCQDHCSKDAREKKLTKVFHEFPFWDASNTVILDDSPSKLVSNEDDNTYVAGGADTVPFLEELKVFWDEGNRDVRQFIKNRQINLPK